jgi:hypothetical protein
MGFDEDENETTLTSPLRDLIAPMWHDSIALAASITCAAQRLAARDLTR